MVVSFSLARSVGIPTNNVASLTHYNFIQKSKHDLVNVRVIQGTTKRNYKYTDLQYRSYTVISKSRSIQGWKQNLYRSRLKLTIPDGPTMVDH